ncbi:hypothetical protein LIER_09541 [Lithospermum erythrorhizon]|uniref:Uncharacterized protein n=1 Tax=Lithospermum erythrorhizon TaxID=34254 RepID=A0AAV3PG19_LITER
MHQHEAKIDDLPIFSLGLSELEENEQDGGSEGEKPEKQRMKDDSEQDIMTTFQKGNGLNSFFVEWVVNKFEAKHTQIRLSKTKVLKLTEEDIHRVYKLLRATKKINLDDCSVASITKLRTELELDGDGFINVPEKVLQAKLSSLTNSVAWTNVVFLTYISHTNIKKKRKSQFQNKEEYKHQTL